MNSGKLLTWLIPAAALLVPGFLFYNWWSNLNAQSRADLQKKVKSNPGLAVFMGGSHNKDLTNPLSSTPAATQASPAAPSAVSTGTVTLTTSSGTAAAAVVATTSGTPAAVSSASASTGSAVAASLEAAAAALGASGAQAVSPASSSGTAVAVGSAAASGLVAQAVAGVVIARDPTLSPYDVVRLQQMELEAKMRSGEVAEATKRVIPKHKEPPVEDKIDLQGIVEIAGGNKAIINGEMVGEGEYVERAKVQKITPSTVYFVYKGRKFLKSISK